MTKEQIAVTDWLKKKVPTKKTKFLHSHVVDYFAGNKAVDLLMQESPWAMPDGKAALEETKEGELVFESREQTVEYLDSLLRFKMFHRAKKIPVTQKDKDEKIPLYKLERVRRRRKPRERLRKNLRKRVRKRARKKARKRARGVKEARRRRRRMRRRRARRRRERRRRERSAWTCTWNRYLSTPVMPTSGSMTQSHGTTGS